MLANPIKFNVNWRTSHSSLYMEQCFCSETTHEEADVIIIHYLVQIAVAVNINVFFDDNDALFLQMHVYMAKYLTNTKTSPNVCDTVCCIYGIGNIT